LITLLKRFVSLFYIPAMAPRPDASETSPSSPLLVAEVLPAHVKDAQNTPIVPLKSDAVSKDQVQGNGDSDFKAPDAKAVPQGSKKSKSSSKKTLGPENNTTEQEKVEGDSKKDREKSSDYKKRSKEAGEVKKSKEAGEVKKGKESGEAVKSKAVNVEETTDFIADSGVELAIEATAEPTPTKPESNISSVTDSSEATRAGEEQKSVDVAVAQKNKSADAAPKTVSVDTAQNKSVDAAEKSMSVDAAQGNKSVEDAQMNKPAENIQINKSGDEKKKEKIHADANVVAQEGVFGKSFIASKPVEITLSTSEVVAKNSESADPKKGVEAAKDILNVEKKATDVKDAAGATKETSEVEIKGAQAVKDIMKIEKKVTDVKEVAGAKKGISEVEAKGAQAVEEILNVDQLTSLVKEALDIKKEVGEAKDKVSSAVKVEVKVPLATPEVSSLTKKVDLSPTDDEVVIVKEVIAKKFGDMTLSDYNSEEDEDYSLSEAESEDSLEWASETERTKAEDDLAEHKVGIDYIGAALDLATEKAASFKTVQAALAMGDWILGTAEGFAPGEVSALLSSIRRRVRKIRRSGERMTGAFRETINQSSLTVASLLSNPLSLLGWQLKPLVEEATKKVLLEEDLVEVEAELCNAETCTFEELNLSDYDSDLDADYSPSEESSSEDELEFNTDAEVSSVVDELELLA